MNFQNSYLDLPEVFYEKIRAEISENQRLRHFNHKLAAELGLKLEALSESELCRIFSGAKLPGSASSLVNRQ
jgi:uncharacterized protein YdiU (UPF0061 family)